MDTAVVEWLLDSDPALRWQVERDLAHAPEEVWRATRSRVAIEGFGARLLSLQDADGQWAGGAYFPAMGRSWFDLPHDSHLGRRGSSRPRAINASRKVKRSL